MPIAHIERYILYSFVYVTHSRELKKHTQQTYQLIVHTPAILFQFACDYSEQQQCIDNYFTVPNQQWDSEYKSEALPQFSVSEAIIQCNYHQISGMTCKCKHWFKLSKSTNRFLVFALTFFYGQFSAAHTLQWGSTPDPVSIPYLLFIDWR